MSNIMQHIAISIADRLFNSQGNGKDIRLVITDNKGRDYGRWKQKLVQDLIEEEIEKYDISMKQSATEWNVSYAEMSDKAIEELTDRSNFPHYGFIDIAYKNSIPADKAKGTRAVKKMYGSSIMSIMKDALELSTGPVFSQRSSPPLALYVHTVAVSADQRALEEG